MLVTVRGVSFNAPFIDPYFWCFVVCGFKLTPTALKFDVAGAEAGTGTESTPHSGRMLVIISKTVRNPCPCTRRVLLSTVTQSYRLAQGIHLLQVFPPKSVNLLQK